MQADHTMLPTGSDLVPRGTPLHVRDMAYLTLRAHFGGLPAEHPFRWDEDPAKTGIGLDVSLNKDSSLYGVKPLVVVSRGSQQAGVTVTGDLAAGPLARPYSRQTNVVSSSVEFRIVGRAPAELEIVSQHVFGLFTTLRTQLPTLLGIHMMQSLSMAPPAKYEEETDVFLVSVSLAYQMQYLWDHEVPSEVLESIGGAAVPRLQAVPQSPVTDESGAAKGPGSGYYLEDGTLSPGGPDGGWFDRVGVWHPGTGSGESAGWYDPAGRWVTGGPGCGWYGPDGMWREGGSERAAFAVPGVRVFQEPHPIDAFLNRLPR